MKINNSLKIQDLKVQIDKFLKYSGEKILSIEDTWLPENGTPVFTVDGTYTTRGWTEWTQGFQFGSAILQYDATGDEQFLEIGRQNTIEKMHPHVTHIGVHDHGFNNVSTYGNLRRLMREGIIPNNENEMHFYEIALKSSAAVQASRWTQIKNGTGYIASFNGPHSLFSDTIRSLRVLAVGHTLGAVLMGEGDVAINLLERLIQHSQTTANYNVYYGEDRDSFDIRGRVVHESIFNTNDGNYRCPSTQQGYSPFSTWTRGLAWIITGYAEQLEFFDTLSDDELESYGGKDQVTSHMRKAVEATADFFIDNTAQDGIPYWDTGAPGLVELGDYLSKPSDPYNEHEPVDSSAAAIAAQGLIRYGNFLEKHGDDSASKYYQAGLTVANTLFDEPYLSTSDKHQGLLLHSVYHRPNGWDYVPEGRKIPCGEASMWGDYHGRELAVLLLREIQGKPYLTFFS
ncbi:glycoside hydrolase family 88 protein [Candidatus Poribacteria bacterium]|nr:glycoside hydrolase family 88 protein [Candidatus Poribacteria bacterium]